MKCTNCSKPIAGRFFDHSGTRTVNGSVMKKAFRKVIFCEPCEIRIRQDQETSRARAAHELEQLKVSLGLK